MVEPAPFFVLATGGRYGEGMALAMRSAIAMIVSCGLTPSEVGTVLPSAR
jgi:hypothetical protein